LTTNATAPDRAHLSRGRRLLAALRRRPRATALAAFVLGLFVVAGALLMPHLRALYHARAAERAIQRWDFDEARAHLAVCLDVWPDSASTRFLATRTARRAGRLDEAERHLKRFQAQNGTSRQTALEWAMLKVQRGEMDDAEGYLRATVGRDDPDAPLVLEALARGFLLTERLADLLECTDLWLQVRPGETHALFWQGLAWERLARKSEAAHAYRQALTADPENVEARLHLAELLLDDEQDAAEARDQFERLRDRRPGDPAVLLGLARCEKALGHPAAARDLLDRLLADHPDHAGGLAERGRLALDEGDAPHAEAWLRRAVDLAPDDRTALHALVHSLWMQDKADQAKALEPALRQLTADLSRYQEVVRAVGKDPRNVALRTEAGTLCLRHGRKDEGRRWLATALQLDPSCEPARDALKAATEGPP
jgi:tetratricopeptide (TPR) repeat protein